MHIYFIALVKSLLLFISLLALSRLIGKRQLSELSHFDYIAGITLGTIAGSASIDERLNGYTTIISIIVWAVLPIIISKINVKHLKFKRFTSGKPLVMIENGIVNDENLIKARYNIEDLLMQLRLKDIFNIAEVEFALLEINGELSILKKSPYNPVTPKDLNINTPYKGLTIELIICGEIIESNLQLSGKDINWLTQELAQKNASDISKVLFAGLTTEGNLQIILKNNIEANRKQ